MSGLRTPDLAHCRHRDAPLETASDDVVSGPAFDDDALQRHVGAATGGPTRRHLQDGLAADAKAAALNDRSEPRTSRRRRRGRSDRDSVPGWRRVLRARQRGENSDCRSGRGHRARHQQVEAPAQGRKVPRPPPLAPRPARLRPAVIADNSAASLEAFMRANVKPGATLITDGHASYPGLAGDYRHDPRVVGVMAANIVLPSTHRACALMKRWALGTYHGLRRKHVDTYLDEFVFRYNRRFYRHVSFETMLGLAANHAPASYRDIVGRASPRKKRVPGTTLPLHIDEPEAAG